MVKYKVLHNPILVRSLPDPAANTVNALPAGSTFLVDHEKNGWLVTISGFYVFKTDNLKPINSDNSIDTDELVDYERTQKEEEKRRKSILDQMIAFDEDAGDDTDDSSDDDGKTDEEKEEEATEKQLDQLNEKYQGKAVTVSKGTMYYVLDDSGQFVRDSAGNPVMKSVPEGLEKEKGNDSMIEYIDNNGYVSIIYKGERYVVNGENASAVLDPKTKKYEQFSISDSMYTNRQFSDLKYAIKNIGKNVYEQIASIDQIDITTSRSIFGLPYQYLPIADNRLDKTFNESSFGRKFMEKIISRAPILIMQPGIPEFLRGYTEKQQNYVLEKLLSIGDSDKSQLESMIKGSGQYYTFKTTPVEYYQSVNGMCRVVAELLGIGDVAMPIKSNPGITGNNQTFSNFNWEEASQHPWAGYYQGCVCFYINSEAQVQEQFSNGTRASELAGKVNQISDQAMEMQFILGGVKSAIGANIGGDLLGKAQETLKSGESRNGSGILQSVVKNLSTMMAGGKMIFPEIWSDSSFGRSYNITIKLDSPDCDKVSIYLNIIVPLIHILGLVLPRSVGDNSYISPYLVRAFYKSMFHIDMGIITGCDVVKGDQGAWTQDGLPTQVTVQLTIKDLYSVMSQALNNGTTDILTNPTQLDYLANLCGINIAPANMMRSIDLWWTIHGKNRVVDAGLNVWSKFAQNVFKQWQNLRNPQWTM